MVTTTRGMARKERERKQQADQALTEQKAPKASQPGVKMERYEERAFGDGDELGVQPTKSKSSLSPRGKRLGSPPEIKREPSCDDKAFLEGLDELGSPHHSELSTEQSRGESSGLKTAADRELQKSLESMRDVISGSSLFPNRGSGVDSTRRF
ncbi:hypothetical protein QFC20_007046 [Naganishia adeliensis]|uniref:Uncharacterized protein n=1 Tax=Naganishia adeliensis TaxID=92952 RepID=A0ACC2V3A8_9TREE|nr:hypothetical protein QFC20_007046 [Naganishia adeliensis]